METKLIAAEIATAAGVTTIITSSKRPENIFSIIEYHAQRSSPAPTSLPSSRPESPIPKPETTEIGDMLPVLARPPHTVFTASASPMRDLKSWTSHTLFPSGTIIIDAGAHHVLSRRESGGRLLAAGVQGVIGAFASGQAVRVVIRRRAEGTPSEEADAAARAAYASALEMTRPSTPTLGTVGSLSSSVTSLEPLSRSLSSSNLEDDLTGPKVPLTVPDEDFVSAERGEMNETDFVEVGRGLANYNSAQISRVKGLNRLVAFSAAWLFC